MTKDRVFVLFLILFLTNFSASIDSIPVKTCRDGTADELVSVVALYRHGDRSPTSSYPNDPYYDISYWPEGYGQLLNKGKERQYNLGQWFRERYSTFLPEEYTYKDIRVISTDVDRTLMSAASNLAGLYPPVTYEIWDEDLLWEPIPIHTTPEDNDMILAMAKECLKRNQLEKEVGSSDYFKNITTENANFFEYISTKIGINATMSTVANLYSVFYVYKNHNSSYIPSWAISLDQQTFSYLAGLDFMYSTFTEQLKRLRVGPFFNYLINYFNDIVRNVTDAPKFLMLSAHDTTLASVLNSMGAYDNWPPEFAATVLWELRRRVDGIHCINLFYKRNSTNSLEELVVNGCSFNCTYDDFKQILVPITVNTTTWEEECTVNNAKQLIPYWFISLLTVILLYGNIE